MNTVSTRPVNYNDLKQRTGSGSNTPKRAQSLPFPVNTSVDERVSVTSQQALQSPSLISTGSSVDHKALFSKITVLEERMGVTLETNKLYPNPEEVLTATGYAEKITLNESNNLSVLSDFSSYALGVLLAAEELAKVKSVFNEYFMTLQTEIQKDLSVTFEVPTHYQLSMAHVYKTTQEDVQKHFEDAKVEAQNRQNEAQELLQRIISVGEGLYKATHQVYKAVGFIGGLKDKVELTLSEIRRNAAVISSFVNHESIIIPSLQELAIKHTFTKKTETIKSFTECIEKFKNHYYNMEKDGNAPAKDQIEGHYKTTKRRYIDLTNRAIDFITKPEIKQKKWVEINALNQNYVPALNEMKKMLDRSQRGFFVGDIRFNFSWGYADSELTLPVAESEVKLEESVLNIYESTIISSNSNPFIPSNSNLGNSVSRSSGSFTPNLTSSNHSLNNSGVSTPVLSNSRTYTPILTSSNQSFNNSLASTPVLNNSGSYAQPNIPQINIMGSYTNTSAHQSPNGSFIGSKKF